MRRVHGLSASVVCSARRVLEGSQSDLLCGDSG